MKRSLLLRRSLRAACWAPLVLLLAPTASSALSVSGNVVLLPSAPASVVEEGLESDTEIRLFLEVSNFTLASALSVNVDTSGTFTTSPGVSSIAAGTVVSSYFIHMDIVDVGDGGSGSPVNLSGSITFDSQVQGIIGDQVELDASDAILGAPGTLYPTGTGARDFWENTDSLTLSADRLTLTFNNMRVADDFTDQLRIIVVPEGSTGTLVALGLVILGLRSRKS